LAWTLHPRATTLPLSMIKSVQKILDAHAFTGGTDAHTHDSLLKATSTAFRLAIECASTVLTATVVLQCVLAIQMGGGGQKSYDTDVQRCLEVTSHATKIWKSSGYEAIIGLVLAKNPPNLSFWGDETLGPARTFAMITASNNARKAHALFSGISNALEAILTVLPFTRNVEGEDLRVLAIDAIHTFVPCGMQIWAAACKLTAANWNPASGLGVLSKMTQKQFIDELWPSSEVRSFVNAVDVYASEGRRFAVEEMVPFDPNADGAFVVADHLTSKLAEAAIGKLEMVYVTAPERPPLPVGEGETTQLWLGRIRSVYNARSDLRVRACLSKDNVPLHGNYNAPIVIPDTLSDTDGVDPKCFFVPMWHPEHERSLPFVMLLTAANGVAATLFTPQQAKRLYTLLVDEDTPPVTLWRARFMTHFNTLSVTDTVSVVPQHTYRMKKDDVEFTLFANPYMYAPLQTVAERAALQKKGADQPKGS
jgi:hypothetical protein